MINGISLSVVMLNVIMASVMAPFLPTFLPAKLPVCALREMIHIKDKEPLTWGQKRKECLHPYCDADSLTRQKTLQNFEPVQSNTDIENM